MNVVNYYWYWKGVLSDKFCDDVIKTGLNENLKIARTGGLEDKNLSKKDINNLKKTRNSNVSFLDRPWIFKTVNEYVSSANKNAGWNFQYDFTESCQFTIYKKTQHYTWHCDSFPMPHPQNHPFESYRGKIRKLSCVIQLTDPKTYKGGELEFDFRNSTKENKSNIQTCKDFNETRGSIIIFPSFVYHRVKPVTKGTRYSLVTWFLGKPYV